MQQQGSGTSAALLLPFIRDLKAIEKIASNKGPFIAKSVKKGYNNNGTVNIK